jgi:RecJ-like exonuclease
MGDLPALVERAREIGSRISQEVNEGKSVIIIASYDADGICAASILAKAIQTKRGRVTVRIVPEVSPELLNQLKEDSHDLHIFCELGAGMAEDFEKVLEGRWHIIDHHQTVDDELAIKNIFNPFRFGFDGGTDASTTSLAYLLAYEIDRSASDLEWFTAVAALADRQDQGENHSLLGLNNASLENVLNHKVGVSIDLLFFGRETRPAHEAIAATTFPYIAGLTGSKDACLATLVSCGIQAKNEDTWRTLADLTADEKKILVDALIPYLTNSTQAERALGQIIGNVYTLLKEDEHSPLRDAREFGALLEACARMGQPGVAVAICMGDRDQSLHEGERMLANYRQALNRCIRTLLGDEERVTEFAKSILITGDGIVNENLLSPLASMLASISRFHGRVLMVKTATESGQFKISARKTPGSGELSNLGLIFQEVSRQCAGRGGGTKSSAGAKIPISRLEPFVKQVNSKI